MKKTLPICAIIALAFAMQSCKKDLNELNQSASTQTDIDRTASPGTNLPSGGNTNGVTPTLGSATNFTVLGLPGTKLDLSSVTINGGNVGVCSGGNLTLGALSTINGDLYLSNGANYTLNGIVNGNTYTAANLTAAKVDAIQAAHDFSVMTPTYTIDNLTTSQVFQGNGGATVINVTNLILGGSDNIMLIGSRSDYFVINVSGNFQLSGNAQIRVSGRASSSHVMVNITGPGTEATEDADCMIFGSVLAVNRKAHMNRLLGQIICGGSKLELSPGAVLDFNPYN